MTDNKAVPPAGGTANDPTGSQDRDHNTGPDARQATIICLRCRTRPPGGPCRDPLCCELLHTLVGNFGIGTDTEKRSPA